MISCHTCVFFHQYRPRGFTHPMTRGQCRRHAPVLYQEEGGVLKTAWPMVHELAFCGEHAQIEERADDQTVEPLGEALPPYEGPEWRCINCKEIILSEIEPAQCPFCHCRQTVPVIRTSDEP